MPKRMSVESHIQTLKEALAAWDEREETDLTPDVIAPMMDLSKLVDTMDFEPEAHDLVMAVDDFLSAVNAYLQRRDQEINFSTPHSPTDRSWQSADLRAMYDHIWATWPVVLKKLPRRERRLPEPVAELQSIRVPGEQICRIYRFLHPDGRPDYEKLKKHIQTEKDGRSDVYDPDTFVSLADERIEKEIAGRWAQRAQRLADIGRPITEGETQRPRQPAPESIEELALLPNMTIEQIARMKLMTEEQVREELEALGAILHAGRIILDEVTMGEVERQEERQRLQNEMLNRLDSHPELGDDLDSRVLACKEDGLRANTIVKLMQRDGISITPQKVGSIIRDAKEQENEPTATA